GCRHDTVQVVFFTDDESFIMDDEDPIESDLCEVVRGSPTRGVIWGEFNWGSTGDFSIHACATTSGGQSNSVSSTLRDAIAARQLYIDHVPPDSFPSEVNVVLTRLKAEDGSRMLTQKQPKKKQ